MQAMSSVFTVNRSFALLQFYCAVNKSLRTNALVKLRLRILQLLVE